jgi:hypothetical protein
MAYLPSVPISHRLETLYRQQFHEFTQLITSTSDISEDDAQTITHEAFLASMRHLPKITNLEMWLTAAVTGATRKAPK